MHIGTRVDEIDLYALASRLKNKKNKNKITTSKQKKHPFFRKQTFQ